VVDGPSRVPVVAACIIRHGKVLATQRGHGTDAGFDEAGWWEFPGGKVRPGEDPVAALRREIAEELGATLEVHEEIATVVHEYPAMTAELTFYRCTLTSSFALTEHRTSRWLGRDELAEVRWLPADLGVLGPLKQILEGLAVVTHLNEGVPDKILELG